MSSEVAREPSRAPDLSILVPAYQQERYVAEAVQSVLGQRDVVAEVIVSDDASPDRTWREIRRVVGGYRGPHGVTLRRGRRRLRRDHLPLLVDHAACDVVMVAHGDDISEPERASAAVEALSVPGRTLIGSAWTAIDDAGSVRSVVGDAVVTDETFDALRLVRWDQRFTGAFLAWRRSAMAHFARLDQAFAAAGHDVILPFRAALAGEVVALGRPLVRHRSHGGQWRRVAWDGRTSETKHFGFALYWLVAVQGMRRDLERACELGLVDVSESGALREELDALHTEQVARVLDNYGALVNEGFIPYWATERETALALQGRLTYSIVLRARFGRLLDRARAWSRSRLHRR